MRVFATPPQTNLYLIDRISEELALLAPSTPAAAGVVVTDQEPPGSPASGGWPARLVVVRDGGRSRESEVSWEHTVTFTVYAGTVAQPYDADDLAELIAGLASAYWLPDNAPGNPIAAVVGQTGPDPIPDDQPIAARYLTVTYRVSGRITGSGVTAFGRKEGGSDGR